jgi:hypothetical protein
MNGKVPVTWWQRARWPPMGREGAGGRESAGAGEERAGEEGGRAGSVLHHGATAELESTVNC